MEEATGKMMDMFNDPNTIKDMAAMMTNMGEMLNNPEKLEETLEDTMNELLLSMSAELDTDEKIEESRQALLMSDMGENPLMAGVFDTDEMKEIINDEGKWRDAMLSGQEKIKSEAGKSKGKKGNKTRKGAAMGEM